MYYLRLVATGALASALTAHPGTANAAVLFSNSFDSAVLSPIESISSNGHVPQRWMIGGSYLGTQSGYYYEDNQSSNYVIKFDLSSVLNPTLHYNMSYSTEACCDSLRIFQGVVQLASYSGSGGGSYDLSLASVNAPIEFRFASDPSIVSTGFRIFDVSLDGTPLNSGVPEPSTWAMMLLGLGLVSSAMRSAKRRQKVAVSYA